MHSATSYHLLLLASIVFFALFSGWVYSTVTVSSWTVSLVDSRNDIAWD